MPRYELNLQDYWRVIRKRRWIIIAIFFAIVIPTLIYTKLQHPVYQAEAQIAIIERKTGGDWLRETFYYTPGDPMKGYAGSITSQGVLTEAALILAAVKVNLISKDAIGHEPINEEKIQKLSEDERQQLKEEQIKIISLIQPAISTKVIPDTNKISIFATAPDQETTCEYANAVAYSFVVYNEAEKTKEARKVRDFIRTQLKETEEHLRESEQELQKFREKYGVSDIALTSYNQLEDLKKTREELLKKYTGKHPDVIHLDKQIQSLRQELSKYSEDEITLARLKRDVIVYTTLYNDLKTKLANAAIESEKASDVSVINEAIRGYEIGGKKGLNLMAGIFLGLMLGLGLAFVIEHMDTSLGTIEEIENLLKLSVLGVIPYLSKEEGKPSSFFSIFTEKSVKNTPQSRGELLRSQMIINYSPLSPITEAYRILRTNVLKNNGSGGTGKIILVTSTGPDEGKSITTINLAITMAENGDRVLLIDSDMRKSMVHKVFGVNREGGLSDLLTGTHKIEKTVRDITDTLMGGISYEVITKTPGIDNLHILTSGSSVPHPAELMSSSNIDVLFKDLKTRYDYILLDCAPVLPVTDVLILGPKVDIVLLVYRAGKTAKNALLRTVEQLKTAAIPIRGVILNYITPEIEVSPTYYYHYYKYYPSDQKG